MYVNTLKKGKAGIQSGQRGRGTELCVHPDVWFCTRDRIGIFGIFLQCSPTCVVVGARIAIALYDENTATRQLSQRL